MIAEHRARLLMASLVATLGCRDSGELPTDERRPYAPREALPVIVLFRDDHHFCAL